MRETTSGHSRVARQLLFAVLICGVCISAGEPGVAGEAETLAFVHASVIPMDSEQIVPDQTVIVAGGRIVAMGPVGAPSSRTESPQSTRRTAT